MISRLCKHFSALLSTGAARIEDDDDPAGFITLVLRGDEAAQGGMICIPMNVDVWCPQCAAQSSSAARPAAAACPRCGGTRTVSELFSAWLAVPPGVRSGEVLAPSVELPGTVDPVRFRVHIRGRGD